MCVRNRRKRDVRDTIRAILLKLYVYGYLHQVRSSRRLEAECRRNVEVMWLLGRLIPDYKSIAEFLSITGEAVGRAGAELVRWARQVGLVKGEWVAIDGSKFRAVASAATVRQREAVKRYLDQLESADEHEEVVLDPSAVAAALEKLKNDAEPEARFMRMAHDEFAPAYNVQTAVDAEHGIIVAQQVTGASWRQPVPAADGRSCQGRAGKSGSAERSGRRGLLER